MLLFCFGGEQKNTRMDGGARLLYITETEVGHLGL